jgi:hypothetical protein
VDRRGRSSDRARLPFWLHQAFEYGVAVLVAGLGLHLGGSTEAALVVAGAVLLLGSLATQGPLGAFRLLSPVAHRVVDWVVVAGLVAVPLVQLPHFDILSAALLWLVGASLAQLARGTRYAGPATRVTAGAVAGTPPATVAAASSSLPPGVVAPGAVVVPVGVAPLADANQAATLVVESSAAVRPPSAGLVAALARLAGRTLGASAPRARSG